MWFREEHSAYSRGIEPPCLGVLGLSLVGLPRIWDQAMEPFWFLVYCQPSVSPSTLCGLLHYSRCTGIVILLEHSLTNIRLENLTTVMCDQGSCLSKKCITKAETTAQSTNKNKNENEKRRQEIHNEARWEGRQWRRC